MNKLLNGTQFKKKSLLLFWGIGLFVFSTIGIAWAANPGDLDPTFDSDGVLYTDVAGTDMAYGVAVDDSTGKVVAVGESDGDFAVARYTSTGILDTTFSGDGLVTTAVSVNVDMALDVVIETDGQIVAVGFEEDAGGNPIAFVAVRYNEDGTLDTNFGSGGIFSDALGGTLAQATAVALQDDGQIIIAGTVDDDFAVARLDASTGALDITFNTVGYNTTDIAGGGRADEAHAVLIQTSGKIVVAGAAEDSGGDHQDFALARYTTEGLLDTTFGSSGRATQDISRNPSLKINDLAYGLDEQSDGKLVLAGIVETADVTNVTDIGLARFSADGILDTTFGTSGTVLTQQADNDWAYDLAVQPTDKILVAGYAIDQGVTNTKENFQIIRYQANGALDTAFAASGYVVTDIGTVVAGGNAQSQDQAYAMALYQDKIVVAGQTDVPLSAGNANFALARYESHNTPPTVTDVTKSGNEDTDLTFSSTDFTGNFSDTNGDSLSKIQITSLPANGILKVSGSAVSENDEITAANLSNLTFTPTSNWFDTTSFNWNGSDGLDYATVGAAVNITINNINDVPSFTFKASPDQSIAEDAGAQSVTGLVASFSPGPNEGSQTVDFLVSNNNTTLFSAQPTIDGSGTLTYTPAANRFGSATVSVQAHDNGTTNNGGQDTSVVETFTITVNAVNDAPTFGNAGNVVVDEDSGATVVSAWASSISEGPFENQTISFNTSNDSPLLFLVNPDVDEISGNLTFTPATDLFGTATVTVTLSDNGGGADTSAPAIFTITVNSVNDAPSFTKGANQNLLEDAGVQSVAGWATGMSVGPVNESEQTWEFAISTNNDALFATLPAVAPNGTLTYTPAANANGSATVTVEMVDSGGVINGGKNTSAAQMFDISITAVNDPPSLTPGANPTVNEDSGAKTYTNWAKNISAGAPDESGQNITMLSMSNDNNALFSDPPNLNLNDGSLTFTPEANAFGSATVTFTIQDNGGIANSGDDTSDPYSFVITVNPVNDAPSFTKGADETVLEDAGAQSAADWATGMSTGPANESTQTWQFNVTTDNDALFDTLPAVAANGTLTYTPAPNANGSATVTVEMQDSGGTTHGGVDTSAAQMFVIAVTAVNDAPSFTNGGDVFVDEEFATLDTTVAGWASNISAGAPDESGQTLTFDVTTNNDSIFTVLPSIDPTSGDLTFTTVGGSGDTATVSVTLSDDGGTANGGDDTADSETFDITVTFVNDAPTFTPGTDQTTDEDAGAQTVNSWASDMDAGSPSESGQVLTFNTSNNNAALFAVAPAIDAQTGDLTYTSAPNAYGSATITVTLSDDGGTANGGSDTSAPQAFMITVNPVNDRPTIADGDVVGKVNEVVTFTAADFEAGFADVDGDNLATVKITALPLNGELALSGTAVTLNQEIPVASLTALTFTPDLNWNGITSFTWNGSDGNEYATTPATMQITIEQFMIYLPAIVRN